MKLHLLLALLMVSLTIADGEPASDKMDLQFPAKSHLTALQLYKMGNPAEVIDKVIGQFVLLDVVVTIERDVPLVEIVRPKELENNSTAKNAVISAHLISVTTEASSLKKADRLTIEGMIVDQGYGAYMIYLHRARMLK